MAGIFDDLFAPPEAATPRAFRRNEDLRDAARLSPEEADADAADRASGPNLAELDRTIQLYRNDPKKREILERERAAILAERGAASADMPRARSNMFADLFESGPARPKSSLSPEALRAAADNTPGFFDRLKQGARNVYGAVRTSLTDDPKEIAKVVAEGQRENLPASPVAQAMHREIQPYLKAANEATGSDAVWAWSKLAAKRFQQLLSNPTEFAGMIVENAPNSAPGIAGMLAGGAAGTATAGPFGGLVGSVVGGTVGGYNVEQGSSMVEQVVKGAQAAGVDLKDENALAGYIQANYGDLLRKSRLKGIGTAGTDAVLNRLTFGLAGMGEKALAKDANRLAEGLKSGAVSAKAGAARASGIEARQAARNTLGARVARGAGITAAEMGGESVSEAAGQKLAYDQVDPLEVVDEGLVGLGQGVGMASGSNAINRLTGAGTKDEADRAIDALAPALDAASEGERRVAAYRAAEQAERDRRAAAVRELAVAPDVDSAIGAFQKATAPVAPVEFDRLGALGTLHAEAPPTASVPVEAIPFDHFTGNRTAPALPAPETRTGRMLNDTDPELTRPEVMADLEDVRNRAQKAREAETAPAEVLGDALTESRLADLGYTPDVRRAMRARITLDDAGNVLEASDVDRRFLGLVRRDARPLAALAIQAHDVNPALVEATLADPNIGPRTEMAIFQKILKQQGAEQVGPAAPGGESATAGTPSGTAAVNQRVEGVGPAAKPSAGAVFQLRGQWLHDMKPGALNLIARNSKSLVERAKARAELDRRNPNREFDRAAHDARKRLWRTIVQAGGISEQEAADIGIDPRSLGGYRMSGLLSGNGMRADILARTLAENGYLSPQQMQDGGDEAARQVVADLLAREFVGTPDEQNRYHELLARRHGEVSAQASGVDILPDVDQAEVADYDVGALAVNAEEAAEDWENFPQASEADLMRALGFNEQEIADVINRETAGTEAGDQSAAREARQDEPGSPDRGRSVDAGRDQEGASRTRGESSDRQGETAVVEKPRLYVQSPDGKRFEVESLEDASRKWVSSGTQAQRIAAMGDKAAVPIVDADGKTVALMDSSGRVSKMTGVDTPPGSDTTLVAPEKDVTPAETLANLDAQKPKAEGQPDVPVSRETPNTEDAGAELSYNRRNRIKGGLKWSDLEGKNETLRVSETNKANVYARPDYEKMLADGMNPLVAHIVKQVYDSIAATPVTRTAPTDENLKTYITAVNRIMDGVMKWANDPLAVAAWAGKQARVASLMRSTSFSFSDIPTGEIKSILDYVYPEGWRNFRAELMIAGGNKALGAMQPGYREAERAEKALKDGWPAKQEAWEKRFDVRNVEMRARNVPGAEGEPVQRWAVYAKGSRYSLARNHPDGGFATEDEAKTWAREQTKRGAKTGISDKGISVELARREGPARRLEGEDVTSDQLKETFGFKGVNFGIWMKGDANKAERQLHLNHAYDAFMDLAEILDVPHKAVSLNGMLGIAFGAQGSGGAAAHFVPGVNEINLTRTSGAGSLAHEWGHGLDHYFATQAGLAGRKEPFLTEHLTGGDGIRPEIVARFAAIVKAMNKKSESPDQAKLRLESARARAAKNVNGWLEAIKRDFMGAKVDDAPFDKLAERIRNLDLGDGRVSVGATSLSPVVDELRGLYKAKTGRTYSLDQTKGLQGNVDHLQYITSDRAAERTHVPQQVTTDYATAAAALDKQKGGKAYWNTDLEKFARAFDAFVSDSLEARAAKNSYLSHAGRANETTPMGDERKAINAEFQALVDAIETRESDESVALFSRRHPDRPGIPGFEGDQVRLVAADSKLLADGSRWVKYDITDPDGRKVGFTTLLFRNGQVAQLNNIEIDTGSRGNGNATDVLRTLLETLPPGAILRIHDIQNGTRPGYEDVRQWWRDRGVTLVNNSTVPEVEIDGTVTLESFREAYDQGRNRSAEADARIGSGNQNPRGSQAGTRAAARSRAGGLSQKDRDWLTAAVRDKPPLGPLNKRADATPHPGLSVSATQAAVDRIAGKWSNGPAVNVLAGPADAPFDAPSDAAGAVHRGEIYVFASNQRGAQDVEGTLFHEALGHYGLRGVFGDALKPALQHLWLANKAVREEAARWIEQYGEDAIAQRIGAGMTRAAAETDVRMLSIEEALADRASQGDTFTGIKRLVVALQRVLREIGMDSVADWLEGLTDAEASRMLAEARQFVEGGAGRSASTNNVAPAFSRRDSDARDSESAEMFDASVADAASPAETKGGLDALKDSVRGVALGGFTRHQLADMYGRDAPEVAEYDRMASDMDAMRASLAQEADAVLQDWRKLGRGVSDRLADIMHEATLGQFDPDTGKTGADFGLPTATKNAIASRFKMLPEPAKEVYRSARDLYGKRLEQLFDTLAARIQRSGADPDAVRQTIDQIREKYDEHLAKGPYFPLARFGDYLLIANRKESTGADDDRMVMSFESARERDRQATMLKAKGYRVKSTVAREYSRARDGSAGPLAEAMTEAIEKLEMDRLDLQTAEGRGLGDIKTQLLDELNQALIRGLPELSYRKHFSHRKGRPGFSRDAMRAFADSQLHAANHIARLEYGDQLVRGLDRLQERITEATEGELTALQQVANEMVKRHEVAMNHVTHPVAAMLGQLGFVMSLGASVASGVVNLMQTPLVTYPWLSARYGWTKTSLAMSNATRQYAESPWEWEAGLNAAKNGNLSGDQLGMLKTLEDRGKINTTLAHDLASASSTDNLNQFSKYGSAWQRTMRMVGWTFHVPEVANRQITALATYDLARQAGDTHEAAIEAAAKAIDETHFDYSSGNRARYFEGDFRRVILMFKQYGQNIAYLYGRAGYQAFKGATAEEKAEARRLLAGMLSMQFAAAGALGLPFVGTAASIFAAMMNGFGDDDQDVDWEVEFRKWLANTFGKDAGEALAHGLPRLVLGWDLAGRIGQNDLFVRAPKKEQEGRDAYFAWMQALAGPVAGYALNGYLGLGDIAKGIGDLDGGKLMRGVEELMPAAIRNSLRAVRYEVEGGLKLRNGEKQLDVSDFEKFGQMLGFTPTRVSEMYEATSAIRNREHLIEARRKDLLDHYAEAIREKDLKRRGEVLEDIREFNQRNPAMSIKPDTLMRSMQNRARRQAGTKDGIYLPRNREFLRDEGAFANV